MPQMVSFYCISKTLLLVFLQLLQLKIVTADMMFVGSYCYEYGNYTQNSTYQNNLNIVLSDLSMQASTADFYYSTRGNSPNKAYGQFYCRGDVSHQQCQVCVQYAAQEIVSKCNNKKEASIMYEVCTLSYANRSLFSLLETDPIWWFRNSTENVLNPTELEQVLSTTTNSLIKRAAYNSTYQGFETGEALLPPYLTLHCLVQCSPDILGSPCERCLRGCYRDLQTYCRGKQWATVFRTKCQLRYTTTLFHTPPSPSSIQASSSAVKYHNKGTVFYIARAVVPAIGLVLLLLCITACYLTWRKDQQKNPDVISYSLNVIKSATDNFSEANRLGQGGFGTVYKGTLPDGQEVAVKKLSEDSKQGFGEFKNEVRLIARLQHINLVKLFGFCLESGERMLIYEFEPNLSLDRFLFDPNKVLDWDTRLKIIKGVARGLLYLHQNPDIKIIHRDLKPSNILLDKEMNPKIADFGVARVMKEGNTQAKANTLHGTMAYMAPEYAKSRVFSFKSDVYSFGVMLLEIISGKNHTLLIRELGATGVIRYAKRLRDLGNEMEVAHSSLRNNLSWIEQVRTCISVGLLCVEKDPSDRPTMDTVIQSLDSLEHNPTDIT